MSWQLPGPAEPGQPQPDPYASAPEQSAAYQPPAYGQPPTYPQAAPGQPGVAPWEQQPTVVKHRPWSTVLVWTIAANGAISVIVTALVLSVPEVREYFVGAAGPGVDESLFMIMMVVAAVIGLVIIAAMLIWAVVARRRADTGQFGALKGLAITVLVFGALGAVGVLSALAQGQPPTGIIGTVLYILAGVKILQALKPRPAYSLGA
jgi:hypothetical protein